MEIRLHLRTEKRLKVLSDLCYYHNVKTYTYRTIIVPDEDGYHGFAPLLRGVHTFGKTIEKTRKNLDDAIRCHLEGLLQK